MNRIGAEVDNQEEIEKEDDIPSEIRCDAESVVTTLIREKSTDIEVVIDVIAEFRSDVDADARTVPSGSQTYVAADINLCMSAYGK